MVNYRINEKYNTKIIIIIYLKNQRYNFLHCAKDKYLSIFIGKV